MVCRNIRYLNRSKSWKKSIEPDMIMREHRLWNFPRRLRVATTRWWQPYNGTWPRQSQGCHRGPTKSAILNIYIWFIMELVCWFFSGTSPTDIKGCSKWWDVNYGPLLGGKSGNPSSLPTRFYLFSHHLVSGVLGATLLLLKNGNEIWLLSDGWSSSPWHQNLGVQFQSLWVDIKNK